MILQVEHVVREFCQRAFRPFEDVQQIICHTQNKLTEIRVRFKEGREAILHSHRAFK